MDTTKMNYDVVYPLSTPSGVILEKNVYAIMRDGVKVALDIYKPVTGEGPWPVIIGYSGWPKEFFFESALPEFYCPNQYVIVQAQARGIGFSQGKFTMLGESEVQDGYDIVEWIAQQTWCDGNIGMMGASYFGVSQWLTALQNPPHLKCIVPCPGLTNHYKAFYYPGGVFSSFAVYLVSSVTQGAIWPGPIPGKELPEDFLTRVYANTAYGPFYEEHGDPWKRIDQIKVPVLSIVSAGNELHAPTHLKSYIDIKAPKKLIITPWNGRVYQPFIFQTTSLNQQILRWFDYWLKGIDTGIMDEPEVAIYDNGTGKWRYENEYPLARTRWTKFYFHERTAKTEPWGSISEVQPTRKENPDTYRHPSPPDKAQFLAYTTPPLEEDLVVRGPVSMTFYASTTEEALSDWSFFVKVGEMVQSGLLLNPVTKEPQIKPDGWLNTTNSWTPREVQLWSFGNLKAKFREVDESKSKPGQPFHSFQNPIDLEPNTIYEFQVELGPIFNTFKKGNKVWIQIAGEDPGYSTWDSSSLYLRRGIEEIPPMKHEIAIYHDSEHQSHLLLPIIPDAPEIAPVRAPLCDVLPGAPRFR
jgi:predicted acyl esterase